VSTDEGVSFSLEVNVEPAYTSLRRIQTLLYRTLGLFRRFGLPENVDRAIAKWQNFIMVLNQARLAVAAFQAATGPIGIGLAVLGVVTTVVTASELSAEAG